MTRKTPLVLLPGLLLDEGLWARQIADLDDVADITVGDLTRGESMRELACSLLDRAPRRFALAGLSMGGYVALEVMRLAPERVARLALLATSARADTPAQTARRKDWLGLAERGRFKGVTPRMLADFLHPDGLDDDSVTGPILRMTGSLGRDVFLRQTRAVMARPDSRAGLANIACPTLVVCGRDDRATPPELAFEIAAAIPGADLVVLGRCGHLAPLERPVEVSSYLRAWLGV